MREGLSAEAGGILNVYPIHRWQAVADLSSSERHLLEGLAGKYVARDPRETIRREGDKVSGLYLLASGWVASSITLPTGARLIQKVHLPGDMLGTASMVLVDAADTLTAITAASVSYVPFERLGDALHRSPRLAALFTYAIQVERLSLMDTFAVKARGSAEGQLAHLFVDLYERLSPLNAVEDDAFDLPLTQDMIGDLVGLTGVHVNRTMRQMRERGLIDQTGRRLRILDLEGLRKLSPIKVRVLRHEPTWLSKADSN